MARKFSHPNVAALEVGESTTVSGFRRSIVTRRVDAFGARKGRAYACGEVIREPDGGMHVRVIRLNDPEQAE